jgi:hypothetical protein
MTSTANGLGGKAVSLTFTSPLPIGCQVISGGTMHFAEANRILVFLGLP